MEKKIYLKSETPINKDLSVLDLKTNKLKDSFLKNVVKKHDWSKEKLQSLDLWCEVSQQLFPNKWEVWGNIDTVVFLYHFGDLPFYYSGGSKNITLKGSYIGISFELKSCIFTGLSMFRDQFSVKEYVNGMWHQTHISGGTNKVLKTRGACTGSNKYVGQMANLIRNYASKETMMLGLVSLSGQLEYENTSSPLNKTVKRILNTPVEGLQKYKGDNTVLSSSILQKLKKEVKFTYRNGRFEWLKYSKKFLEHFETLTTKRSYYYDGIDYVESSSNHRLPTSKYIEPYYFRGELKDRTIYDLDNYAGSESLVEKIKNSPQRVPELLITNTLNHYCKVILTPSLVKLLLDKKEETTKHLITPVGLRKRLKI